MALKGFTRDILIEKLNYIAVKELATATKRWECGTVVQSGTSLFRMGLTTRIKNVNRFWTKLFEYATLAEEDKKKKGEYNNNIKILAKLIKDYTMATMDFQRDIYGKEHNIYNSHSQVEIPLDKRPELNALYDDFTAYYLFHDNISTIGRNMGTFLESLGHETSRIKYFVKNFITDKEIADDLIKAKPADRKRIWTEKHGMDACDYFEGIEDTQERIRYVIENTEFTHCTIGGTFNPNWAIGVYGNVEPSLSAFDKGPAQQVLPCEYCDFTKVTLADTLKIKNQDLMQIMQARIDLDKENLEIADEKTIGGDFYQLEHIDPKMLEGTEKRNEYLVRFECPSTGRPYHVDIDVDMLRFSKYYVKGDPTSYIEAWWHITHGGMDPRKATYVIRT